MDLERFLVSLVALHFLGSLFILLSLLNIFVTKLSRSRQLWVTQMSDIQANYQLEGLSAHSFSGFFLHHGWLAKLKFAHFLD